MGLIATICQERLSLKIWYLVKTPCLSLIMHTMIEMYIKSVDGFEGEGDFLSKFNVEIRDEMVLTVSRRRFGEEISDSRYH